MTGALAGFTIGVTGDRRWEEQAEMLSRRGAQVVHGPVMRTTLLHDAGATLAATRAALERPIDIVVLTTGIGTRSWFGVAESAGLDDRLRAVGQLAQVLARGPKARTAASANGLDVHWQAAGETSAEVVVRLREMGVEGRRIVVQRDGGRPVLAEVVRDLGAAEVIDIPVYRWEPPHDPTPAIRLLDAAIQRRLHAVTFTSGFGVGSAFELTSDADALTEAFNGPVAAMAVGPVTAAALRAHGVTRVIEPTRARLGAMVQVAVTELSSRHLVLRHGDESVRWQGDLLIGADLGEALLTPGETRVLTELLRRSPAVVPKRSLVEPGTDEHAAEAAVGRLRRKLGPMGEGIRAVPRRGYACTLRVEPAPQLDPVDVG